MTPGRIALVVLATAGLLFLAVMVVRRRTRFGGRLGGRCHHGCLRDRAVRSTPLGLPEAASDLRGSPWLAGWAAGQLGWPVVLRRSARHRANLGFLGS